jgi:hypothetical protein
MAEPSEGANGTNGGDGGNGETGPPPPPPNPNLRVAAIECTQAIQYFNFNGQGTGIASDNSIPFIPGKTTIFRVYPDVSQVSNAFPVPPLITADLTVYRINTTYQPDVIQLNPINGPIPAAPASSIQRANTDHTLNFRLPAWKSTPGTKGTMVISAQIKDAGLTGPAPYYAQSLSQYTPPFFGGGSLRVFGVRIIYTGPDATGKSTRIGPPTEQEMINTLTGSFVTRSQPWSGITYTGHAVAEFDGDLSVSGPNGCGPGWNQLMKMLTDMAAASNNSSIYVGFLPTGAPANVAFGCGSIAVAAGFVSSPFTTAGLQAQITMAQEIGHAFARRHAPCAVSAPNLDTGYPAYATGPSGSIGEVGFDSETGVTFSPLTTTDFMSYCTKNWVSPYTYEALHYLSLFLPAFS